MWPGYGAVGLTSRVSELAECRKCLCVIRFWSETGGGAGGGEVRSQPRLGDGRLNSATPFSRWVGGLQAPVLRHGVRVLTEMLSQTKCFFAVCMSLRGQEVGGSYSCRELGLGHSFFHKLCQMPIPWAGAALCTLV